GLDVFGEQSHGAMSLLVGTPPRGGPLNAGRDVRVFLSVDNQACPRSFPGTQEPRDLMPQARCDLIVMLCDCHVAPWGLESGGSGPILDQLIWRKRAFGNGRSQLSRAAQCRLFDVRNL